ncbi:MAG: ribonuclease III, partial [Alphaproteobacteria bacterium]|nr:ribonuclease III [Alphaproteobacteria bacterium]
GGESAGAVGGGVGAWVGAAWREGRRGPSEVVAATRCAPLLAEGGAPPREPKTALQEWSQGRGLKLPIYEVLTQTGVAHAPHFTVRVTVESHAPETGSGPNKREAERDAAAKLLARLEGSKI